MSLAKKMIPRHQKSLWSGSLLLAVVFGLLLCTGRTDPVRTKGSTSLRIGLQLAGDTSEIDSVTIDTVIVSVFSDDSSVFHSARCAYRDRRASFPRIPCEIPITISIAALDPDGMVLFSGQTDIASVECGGMSVVFDRSMVTPLRPLRLSIDSSGTDFIALSWLHDTTGTQSYDIIRLKGDTAVFAGGSATTTFHDTGLAPSQLYAYKIRARNNAGVSDWLYTPAIRTSDADTLAPSFSLLSHNLRDTVNTSTIRLYGTIDDPSGVAWLKLGSSPLSLEKGFWVIDSLQIPDSGATFSFTYQDSAMPTNTGTTSVAIAFTTQEIETTPPLIGLLEPRDGDTVAVSRMVFLGIADDQSGIDSVYVNGAPAEVEGLSWRSDTIDLDPGPNTITVIARDSSLAGNQSTRSFHIVYQDPCASATPPSLRILSHSRSDTVAYRLVRLVGSAYSPFGIQWVMVADDTLAVHNGIWENNGMLIDSGYNEIQITAKDSCGSSDSTILWKIWYIPTYVAPANTPPVFTVSSTNLTDTIKAGQTHSRILTAIDFDSLNTLSFAVDSPLTLVDDSMAQWTTTVDDTGRYTLTAYVRDQEGASDTVSWTLTVLDSSVNFLPRFISTADSLLDSVAVGLTYTDTLRGEDPDGDEIVFRFAAQQPQGMELDSLTGALSWTPDSSMRGKNAMLVQIDDQRGGTATLSFSITVWDPNLPVVSAGPDRVVSIRDSVELSGSATSEVSAISLTEWDIGGSGTFLPSRPDTSFVLPDHMLFDSTLTCILRAWDTQLRSNVDTVLVRIRRNPPVADAGRDTVVRGGESFVLHGSGTDPNGTVQGYAWDIGATGSFVPSADGTASGTAPLAIGPFRCVLRVTDDDNVPGFDTMIVHVANPGMIRLAGHPDSLMEDRYIQVFLGNESGQPEEAPVHEVWVTPFWIDSVEVTVGEYAQLMGADPTGGADSSTPVQNVTWFDAVLFCNARSKAVGMDTVYRYTGVSGNAGNGCTGLSGLTILYDNVGYRLPTEAEWEYACRGNTPERTEYFWSNEPTIAGSFAWYSGNASETTHQVATKTPNNFGLYDMAGNVAEWCNDWYSPTYYTECDTGIVIDPRGPATGSTRLNRGGSFESEATGLRTSARGLGIPNWRAGFVGFRTVVPSQ